MPKNLKNVRSGKIRVENTSFGRTPTSGEPHLARRNSSRSVEEERLIFYNNQSDACEGRSE
jgi:hypothetical protein